MGISQRLFRRRLVASLVILGTFGGGLTPVAGQPDDEEADPGSGEPAEWWDDLVPSTPDDDPVAPPVEPPELAPLVEDTPMDTSGGQRSCPSRGPSM